MPDTQPLAEGEHLFTSESVTEGHPDKVCDQISDGVLDAVMAHGEGEDARVACETLVNTNLVVISGEIRTEADLNLTEIARETIREIGYDGFDPNFGADTRRGARADGPAVARHRPGRRRRPGDARGGLATTTPTRPGPATRA